MKKIFTIIAFFVFIATNLFAVNFYVDQHHKNASDTTADSQGLSWSKPFKSPTYAYEQTIDNRGDSIHIAQGIYEFKKGSATYNITLNKRNVEWIVYGEVWFEGLGKSVSSNNNCFQLLTTITNNRFGALKFKGFNHVFSSSGSGDYAIARINGAVFLDNLFSFNLGINFHVTNFNCNGYNLVFINSPLRFTGQNDAGYSATLSNIYNSTFFNSPITLSAQYKNLQHFQNNIMFNSDISLNRILNINNNNYYNSTSTQGYGANATFHNPLFNDTNSLNPILTLRRESPVRNISTTGSFLGAYGVADYSTSNDTLTWSGWYSWTSSNDSVSIYNDTAFIVDTNGITLQYGSQYPKYRRITRTFSNLGTIYGTPLKSFSNQTEVFNTGDYIDYWAVIDYDTSTSIREYRYIASSEEITEEDLRENSGKWSTIGFTESLPTFTSKYFAVEIFFRYNF